MSGDRHVLVTGGAGFVGANLAVELATRHPEWELTALDNLHRRGSELNLPRLGAAGVGFVRADVRDAAALAALPPVTDIVECSAEPSALAGLDGNTAYSFETNLVGARNCLELARRDRAAMLFLSTSRVYPHSRVAEIDLEESATRFEIAAEQTLPGVSVNGIAEDFPLDGPRTLYGATKLAAELLVTEYGAAFGLRTVVDRCGVIAGPWQMGRVDQGVFSLWLLHHYFGRPLSYIGYGGEGKQVRDLLHVADLVELIDEQISDLERWDGFVGNVGGGTACSLSLAETTALCRELTSRDVPIEPVLDARPGDVPLYISDCSRLASSTPWRPTRSPREILADILAWIRENEESLGPALGFAGAAG